MKFLIPTQEFNYLLNKVQNVIPVKPAIPVLANVLIEASQGMLILTGSDLTVAVRCETDVKIFEEGIIALPAKRLVPLVRELTAPELELVVDDNQTAHIKSGSSKFKIHGMRGLDYPKMPVMAGAISFKMKADVLKELLYSVSFAVAKEDSRFVLTGVLMRVADGLLTFLGSDGKRLARAQQALEVDRTLSGSYIIPLKAVEELLKSLSEQEEAVISVLPDKIAFQVGKTTLITKLLAGEFPDVSRVIPERSELTVSLHREELTTLLRQVSLFTSEEFHSVKFTFADGELKLSANATDLGEGKVSMPVNYRGAEFQIAFSPQFFLDALRHSKGEVVTLGLTDPYNPGVLTENEGSLSSTHGASPLFVLMPMRLQNATA
jgi:DNA polymerase-3 subunit beta